MTRHGIEPRSPGPLANTLPTSRLEYLEIISLPMFINQPTRKPAENNT